MARARKVCLFSGKRGGFNHFIPILELCHDDPDLECPVIVSDMHLAESFGNTVDEVRQYANEVHTVETLMGSDSKVSRVKSLGVGILGAADLLAKLRPDFLLVLGDRLEIMAPVLIAMQLNIPILHIAGGDVTQGGVDEVIRHAVTKLASIHFATNQESAARIRAMGEESWRVHNVGSPALDLIQKGRFTPAEETRDRFGLDPKRKTVILLQHSVTWAVEEAGSQIEETLSALDDEELDVVAIYPCSDPGYAEIVEKLLRFRQGRPWFQVHKNLKGPDFWGLMNVASAMVGNSSAGPMETPSFRLPCLNIGTRQEDRLRAENVLDVEHDQQAIRAALQRALSEESFLELVEGCATPYGDGNASNRIIDVIKDLPLDGSIVRKRLSLYSDEDDKGTTP